MSRVGVVTATSHAGSIALAVDLFPASSLFQSDLTHGVLTRENFPGGKTKTSSLKKRRQKFVEETKHKAPGSDFDYVAAALSVYNTARSEGSTARLGDLGERYKKLLNVHSDDRGPSKEMLDGHDVEALVRGWLSRSSKGLEHTAEQELYWVDGSGVDAYYAAKMAARRLATNAKKNKRSSSPASGDGGGAQPSQTEHALTPAQLSQLPLPVLLDPIEAVAKDLNVDRVNVTFDEEQPGVKLVVGCSVACSIDVRGSAASRGRSRAASSTNRSTSRVARHEGGVTIIVEVKYGTPTPSATDLQVQGQLLVAHNGVVHDTAKQGGAVVAYVAVVRGRLRHGKRLVEFRRVAYDPAVQKRLSHYAKLNVALARLFCPELFKSTYQDVANLKSIATPAPQKMGALCHAECPAEFKVAHRSPRSTTVTDVCSCGARIVYKARADGGTPPPDTTTDSEATCPWNHMACPGVYLLKACSLHKDHLESRHESETKVLRSIGATDRIMELVGSAHVPPTATARIIAMDYGEDLAEDYVVSSRSIRGITRANRGHCTEADMGIPGLLAALHEHRNPYVVR